ncbi:hypothetical protein ACFY20_34210 [Streptomyces sp. NPDC001312]|uniref:hypothetical protein n=1 Tax=Streptomyces sp. NPDC001312 TaxID=3364561 RepID=UPI0036C5E8F1
MVSEAVPCLPSLRYPVGEHGRGHRFLTVSRLSTLAMSGKRALTAIRQARAHVRELVWALAGRVMMYGASGGGMSFVEIGRAGIAEIEYSYFSIGEMQDPGFEPVETQVDFSTPEPVIVVPGQIVVVSRVRTHRAPVVLAAAAEGEEPVPGDGWQMVATKSYAPVYAGRMFACDTMNGPASPAPEPVEVFGQRINPGEPAIDLDSSRVYRVQVWARGREDSRERHEEAMEREEWGASEGFEAYAVAFTPQRKQEPPVPRNEDRLRERFARQRAEEDEIARLLAGQ